MKEKQSGVVELPETALVVRAMLNWIYAGSHCYEKSKKTDVVAILSLLVLLIACYAAAEKYSTFAWKTVLVTLFTTWAKCAATVLTDDSSARHIKAISFDRFDLFTSAHCNLKTRSEWWRRSTRTNSRV
jgi:xanthine/uracil permease